MPAIPHVLGDAAPFLETGFTLERMHVLSATAVVLPPKIDAEIEVRPLCSETERLAALEIALDVGHHDEGHAEVASYSTFVERGLATYRRMEAAGLGHLWGAFRGDTLVAKLGLFFTGEVGRFQEVATARGHRRRGICGTLVYEVCRRALAERPDRTLVMCAVEDYHATRIYQSLGFRVTERQVDFLRRPPGSMR